MNLVQNNIRYNDRLTNKKNARLTFHRFHRAILKLDKFNEKIHYDAK